MLSGEQMQRIVNQAIINAQVSHGTIAAIFIQERWNFKQMVAPLLFLYTFY